MDESEKFANPNPWEKAGIVNQLFFWWVNPLMRKGYRNPLYVSDLYNIPEGSKSSKQCELLEREWDKEVEKNRQGKKPSLLKALLRAYGRVLLLNSILLLVEECLLETADPFILKILITSFRNPTNWYQPYLIVAGLILKKFLSCLLVNCYHFNGERICLQIRVATSGLLYRKAIRHKGSTQELEKMGECINLLSNDVERFDRAYNVLPCLVTVPFKTAMVMVILWYQLGPASLAGLAVLLTVVTMQMIWGKGYAVLRLRAAKLTDERVRVTDETLSGMKLIRMRVWESYFIQCIKKLRRLEIRMLLLIGGFTKTLRVISWCSGSIATCVALLVYIKSGHLMLPEVAFVALSTYGMARNTFLNILPIAILDAASSIVSMTRLQNYFLRENAPEEDEKTRKVSLHLGIRRFSMARDPASKKTILTPALQLDTLDKRKNSGYDNKGFEATPETGWDISEKNGSKIASSPLSLPPAAELKKLYSEKLVMINGSMGSGKSTLLMSALKDSAESEKYRYSYASQEPWVFCASIRQNILFGQPFNAQRYQKVLQACALDEDIRKLPMGDRSPVGEKGTQISGGQRARINLARALYYEADVYLIDDPLSALDVRVAGQVFHRCFKKFLRNKVIVMSCNESRFIPEADHIIFVKNFSIAAQGSHQSMCKAGWIRETQELKKTVENEKELDFPEAVSSSSEEHPQASENTSAGWSDSEEQRSTGTVKFSYYLDYVRTGINIFGVIVLLAFGILGIAMIKLSSFVLSNWSKTQEKLSTLLMNKTLQNNAQLGTTIRTLDNSSKVLELEAISDRQMLQYCLLVLSEFVLLAIFFWLCLLVLLRSTYRLHNRMLTAVMTTKMIILDRTPIGQVLNRFTRDLRYMDEDLREDLIHLFIVSNYIVGSYIVAVIVNFWIAIPTVITIGIVMYMVQYYLKSAREIRRLDCVTRSPVFSHMSDTIRGLPTIKAFRMESQLTVEFDNIQDVQSSAWFLYLATSRWMILGMNLLFLVFLAITSAIFFSTSGVLHGGDVGFVFTSVLPALTFMQFGIKSYTNVENKMTSVERVVEFCALPHESDQSADATKETPADWPKKGKITFRNVHLQYSDKGQVALKNLTFVVSPGEKIGIVGRTGAGKTSIVTALFRLAESDGIIAIDGTDIKSVSMTHLRKKISIIPQTPFTFKGSLRSNIDPLYEHTDQELWAVLESVNLKPMVTNLPGGLDYQMCHDIKPKKSKQPTKPPVKFSIGQRQLLSLASVLLQNNNILVADEPNAHLDEQTTGMVDEILMEKFQNSTVIVIAHRLKTVLSCDRVMVLQEGEIAEFDTPKNLLINKASHLSQMVNEMGGDENSTEIYLRNRDNRLRKTM